eukprot:m.77076 g.77076  ORF g.77076 m.77076 type:complete len:1176 (+) comp7905_c0_seq1:81-3608(+)
MADCQGCDGVCANCRARVCRAECLALARNQRVPLCKNGCGRTACLMCISTTDHLACTKCSLVSCRHCASARGPLMLSPDPALHRKPIQVYTCSACARVVCEVCFLGNLVERREILAQCARCKKFLCDFCKPANMAGQESIMSGCYACSKCYCNDCVGLSTIVCRNTDCSCDARCVCDVVCIECREEKCRRCGMGLTRDEAAALRVRKKALQKERAQQAKAPLSAPEMVAELESLERREARATKIAMQLIMEEHEAAAAVERRKAKKKAKKKGSRDADGEPDAPLAPPHVHGMHAHGPGCTHDHAHPVFGHPHARGPHSPAQTKPDTPSSSTASVLGSSAASSGTGSAAGSSAASVAPSVAPSSAASTDGKPGAAVGGDAGKGKKKGKKDDKADAEKNAALIRERAGAAIEDAIERGDVSDLEEAIAVANALGINTHSASKALRRLIRVNQLSTELQDALAAPTEENLEAVLQGLESVSGRVVVRLQPDIDFARAVLASLRESRETAAAVAASLAAVAADKEAAKQAAAAEREAAKASDKAAPKAAKAPASSAPSAKNEQSKGKAAPPANTQPSGPAPRTASTAVPAAQPAQAPPQQPAAAIVKEATVAEKLARLGLTTSGQPHRQQAPPQPAPQPQPQIVRPPVAGQPVAGQPVAGQVAAGAGLDTSQQRLMSLLNGSKPLPTGQHVQILTNTNRPTAPLPSSAPAGSTLVPGPNDPARMARPAVPTSKPPTPGMLPTPVTGPHGILLPPSLAGRVSGPGQLPSPAGQGFPFSAASMLQSLVMGAQRPPWDPAYARQHGPGQMPPSTARPPQAAPQGVPPQLQQFPGNFQGNLTRPPFVGQGQPSYPPPFTQGYGPNAPPGQHFQAGNGHPQGPQYPPGMGPPTTQYGYPNQFPGPYQQQPPQQAPQHQYSQPMQPSSAPPYNPPQYSMYPPSQPPPVHDPYASYHPNNNNPQFNGPAPPPFTSAGPQPQYANTAAPFLNATTMSAPAFGAPPGPGTFGSAATSTFGSAPQSTNGYPGVSQPGTGTFGAAPPGVSLFPGQQAASTASSSVTQPTSQASLAFLDGAGAGFDSGAARDAVQAEAFTFSHGPGQALGDGWGASGSFGEADSVPAWTEDELPWASASTINEVLGDSIVHCQVCNALAGPAGCGHGALCDTCERGGCPQCRVEAACSAWA